MPILLVYGMPKDTPELVQLADWLGNTVQMYPKLELTPQQVTVFYPADCCKERAGEAIILLVEGLFDKPERTEELRQEWADGLCSLLVRFAKQHLPQCQLVEVLMKKFSLTANTFAFSQF